VLGASGLEHMHSRATKLHPEPEVGKALLMVAGSTFPPFSLDQSSYDDLAEYQQTQLCKRLLASGYVNLISKLPAVSACFPNLLPV
jgi:hypothetical protein